MTRLFTMTTMLLSGILAGCSSEQEVVTPSTPVESNSVTQTTQVTPVSFSSGNTSALDPDDFFSNRDYRTTIESETPVTLTFDGGSITADGDGVEISGSTVTIVSEGTYILTGSLTEGQVVVDMADATHKAQLVLDNVSIQNSTTAAIHVPVADKVFVTMTEGSVNHFDINIDNEESVDGAIFARADLTLNGEGTLNINITGGDGVVGKDELTITSGTYNITGDGHGMDANDSIAIADGTFVFQVEKDGFHCEHSSNESKGNIYILDGEFHLDVLRDGIDVSGFLEINGGYFDITTNGGWESAPVKVAAANAHGGGMTGMMGGREDMVGMMEGMDMDAMASMREEMMGQMGGQTGREDMMAQGQVGQDAQMQQGQQGQDAQIQQGQQAQIGQDAQMQQGQQGQVGQDAQIQQGQQTQVGQEQSQRGEQNQMGGMAGNFMLPENFELPEGITLPEGLDLSDLSTMTPEMMEEIMAQMTPEIMESLMGSMGNNMGGMPEGNYIVDGSDEDLDAPSTKGLKSVGDLRIYGGTFILDCYDDAIHSDTRLEIHDGDYSIGTADDALHATWETIITGGVINIESCFEGIEGQQIDISGGYIDMYCGDDGINAATKTTNPDDSTISLTISGGTIIMDTNSEGDGVDSNGSILITGGDLLISSTTDTRDTQLDSQYDSIITGGRFIATGSNSGTIQNFDDGSTQGSILMVLSSVTSGQVTLTDSSGTVLVDFLPVKAYQSVTISIPELTVGETYTLVAGEYTETITMDSLQAGSSTGPGSGGMTGRR